MDTQNDSNDVLLNVSDEFVAWNINAREAMMYFPAGMFVICLFIIGLPGNCMVVYVYQYYFKATTANFYIKMLAVLDAVCCTFGMTFELVDMFFPLLNGEPASCRIFRMIEQTAEFISAEVLLLIAFDRYIHICKPFKVFTISTAKRLAIIAIVVGTAASVPTLLVMRRLNVIIDGISFPICSRDLVHDTSFTLIYYIFINSVLALIFITIIGLYVCVWSTLYKLRHPSFRRDQSMPFGRLISVSGYNRHNITSSTSVNEQPTDNILVATLNKIRQKRLVKPVIILFMVTFVFLISYLPYCILGLIETVKIEDVKHFSSYHRQIWEVFNKSYFLSNFINPVIYATMDHKFRAKCQDVLFRKGHFRRLHI